MQKQRYPSRFQVMLQSCTTYDARLCSRHARTVKAENINRRLISQISLCSTKIKKVMAAEGSCLHLPESDSAFGLRYSGRGWSSSKTLELCCDWRSMTLLVRPNMLRGSRKCQLLDPTSSVFWLQGIYVFCSGNVYTCASSHWCFTMLYEGFCCFTWFIAASFVS